MGRSLLYIEGSFPWVLVSYIIGLRWSSKSDKVNIYDLSAKQTLMVSVSNSSIAMNFFFLRTEYSQGLCSPLLSCSTAGRLHFKSAQKLKDVNVLVWWEQLHGHGIWRRKDLDLISFAVTEWKPSSCLNTTHPEGGQSSKKLSFHTDSQSTFSLS